MKKIEILRNEMKKNGIQYYIIPSSDPHQSEYVADYYKGRAYISGFTGSAGTLLVGLDCAKLWTDGRYFIQALKELDGSGIDLMKMNTEGYPTIERWIKDNVKSGEAIGFDGRCYSVNQYKNLLKITKSKNINIKMDKDLLEVVWEDRPKLPISKIFLHDIEFSGKSASEKLVKVRSEMKKVGVDTYIISSLDDIAWLFNVRGSDIEFNPVVISYALITDEKAKLYIDKIKVSDDVLRELTEQGIEVCDYTDIKEDVERIETNVLIDAGKTNAYIYSSISKDVERIEGINITTKLKALKNDVEISNIKRSHIRDGVAMVRFLKWLREKINSENITEISASDKLFEFRAMGENFKGSSFGTIAAYKDHAAMMHYSATEESQYVLKTNGMFLVDSGGQYLDGTTDITRTIVLGNISEEEKRDFTLVLKGLIGLSRAKFLKGTTGMNLDILARGPLWQYGIDYKCGTGHGLGFFLNVHEGPQGFRQSGNTTILEEGMLTTNEPGVYKEGKHGIRTENTLLVVKDRINEENDEFFKFDTVSYCPIDVRGIDAELLNDEELRWLNEYHEEVFKNLSPYLSEDEKSFLRRETEQIVSK